MSSLESGRSTESFFDTVYDISVKEEALRKDLTEADQFIQYFRNVIEEASIQLNRYNEKKLRVCLCSFTASRFTGTMYDKLIFTAKSVSIQQLQCMVNCLFYNNILFTPWHCQAFGYKHILLLVFLIISLMYMSEFFYFTGNMKCPYL